jgi:DNA-binding response OmpR family regulator
MPTKTGSGVIVVVEDPFVRNFLRSVLERQGYEVLSGGIWHGLAALRHGSREVQLLITNLPSAFTEFADRVPLLYLAALPDPSLVSQYRNSRVLSKPFHPHQLLASVQELLRLRAVPVRERRAGAAAGASRAGVRPPL